MDNLDIFASSKWVLNFILIKTNISNCFVCLPRDWYGEAFCTRIIWKNEIIELKSLLDSTAFYLQLVLQYFQKLYRSAKLAHMIVYDLNYNAGLYICEAQLQDEVNARG